jgi:hypothetical protein
MLMMKKERTVGGLTRSDFIWGFGVYLVLWHLARPRDMLSLRFWMASSINSLVMFERVQTSSTPSAKTPTPQLLLHPKYLSLQS